MEKQSIEGEVSSGTAISLHLGGVYIFLFMGQAGNPIDEKLK